jgi:hypothetical protein
MHTKPQSKIMQRMNDYWFRQFRQMVRRALPLLFIAIVATPVHTVIAGTLNGTVRNNAGTPLNNVRVDLVGPAKRVTATDSSGKFSLNAPGGTYRLMITYKGRRVRTDITLPAGSASIDKTFTLN